MALLEQLRTGRRWPLAAHTLIGRSPACLLRLEAPAASTEHAKLVWTADERWSLRDLGSKNGTYVDGRRLEVGAERALHGGAEIAFGDPHEVWRLADDGPPRLIARALGDGALVAERAGVLALPTEAEPRVVLYHDGRGRWVAETDGAVRALEDQAVVEVLGRPWCVHLPAEREGTPIAERAMPFEAVRFSFAVSRDEEQVELTLIHGALRVTLERREHAYLLLTLARERRADAARPVEDRGWVARARLESMLRMDANALNVAVHRARQQIHAAGVEGAAAVVEVRKTDRRFGTDEFEIVPLG